MIALTWRALLVAVLVLLAFPAGVYGSLYLAVTLLEPAQP
jgi:hypothetical protein